MVVEGVISGLMAKAVINRKVVTARPIQTTQETHLLTFTLTFFQIETQSK